MNKHNNMHRHNNEVLIRSIVKGWMAEFTHLIKDIEKRVCALEKDIQTGNKYQKFIKENPREALLKPSNNLNIDIPKGSKSKFKRQ